MTAKVILYKRYKSKDGTYPLVIRLISGSKQKLFPVGYKIKPEQWAANTVKRHPDSKIINADYF